MTRPAARMRAAVTAPVIAALLLAAVAAPASAQWSAPIDQTTGVVANEPAVVALDSAGNSTTLVRRSLPSGGNELVSIDTRSAAATASNAVPLMTTADANALVQRFRLAVSPAGAAVAVWTLWADPDVFTALDETCVVLAATRPSAGAWSTATQLSAPGRLVDECEVDLAMNSSGEALAGWPVVRTSGAAIDPSIGFRVFTGGAWGDTHSVANGDNANMKSPRVALDSTGIANIAWVHEAPTMDRREIRFVSGPATTDLGAGTTVSAIGVQVYSALKDLVVNGTGDVALTWTTQPAIGDPVLYVGVDESADGLPMAVDPIDEHATTEVAHVALSDSGMTTLIYSRVGATHDLVAHQRASGGVWSDVEELTTSLQPGRTVVGVDAAGVVTVGYLELDGVHVMRHVNGRWQLGELVGASGWPPEYLAVNAAGDRALTYRAGAFDHLWLARESAPRAPVIVAPPVGGVPPKDDTIPSVTKDPIGDVKWPTVLTDTTSVDKVPSVIGLSASAARDRFDRVGIEADFDIRMLHRATPPKGIGVGDVIAQKPAAGTSVTTAIRNSELVRLEIYAGPAVTKATKAGCSAARVSAAVKGLELDLAKPLLKSMKCPYQVDVRPVAKGDDATVTGASVAQGVVRLGVSVPSTPAKNDLFMLMRENPNGIGFERSDWTLTAGQKNAFTVQVIDRGFRLVRKANLTFDMAAVGAPNQTGQSGPTGEKVTLVTPTRAGTIDVLVELPGADGQSLWGYAQVKVVDRSSAKLGAKLGTVAGRVFQKSKLGTWVELPNGTMTSAKRGTGKSARGLGDLWGQFASWMQGLAAPITNAFAAKPVSPEQVLRTTLKQQNIAPGQLALGSSLIGANVHAAAIEAAGVVAAGGGNVVAAGGGNVVAPGGGNVIAAGGGNVVAAGGGNVVAAGGGNAIFAAGPGVVAAGGGNLTSIAAGNVVAAGGGNVIAAGGGNVVASGGLN